MALKIDKYLFFERYSKSAKIWNKLNLDNSGINTPSDLRKILETVGDLLCLTHVSIMNNAYENIPEAIKKDEYEKISEILSSNVSITHLSLMDNQDDELPDIRFKIRENLRLKSTKEYLLRIQDSRSYPIHIEEIKLCLRIKVQLELFNNLTDDQEFTLRSFLEKDNHNIFHLNLSRASNQWVSKVIKMLSKPKINYKNIKIFNFGHRNMEQRDFIMFGKWLINKFSDYKDNDHQNLSKKLLPN